MTQAPLEIRLKADARQLVVRFADHSEATYSSEFLRVHSPSAEVQGHGGRGGQLVSGKADISISGIEPVGHYAIKIVFSDGHNTGLYTWDTLYRFSQNYSQLWQSYLEAINQAGLNRSV